MHASFPLGAFHKSQERSKRERKSFSAKASRKPSVEREREGEDMARREKEGKKRRRKEKKGKDQQEKRTTYSHPTPSREALAQGFQCGRHAFSQAFAAASSGPLS
jgi:hypothetical protein